jgi:hypothetical protein
MRALKIAAGIVISFAGLAGTIILLSGAEIISPVMAILMLVTLLGLYFGCGVLIALYYLTGKMK